MEEQAEQPSEYRGEDTEHTEDTAPRRGRFLGEVWEIAKVLLISAAVVLTTLPVGAMVLAFQKRIIAGRTAGAVKG